MLLYLSDLLYRILPFIPTTDSTLQRLAIGPDIYFVRNIGQLVSLASKFLRFAGLLFHPAARLDRIVTRMLSYAAGLIFSGQKMPV
ncbi:hypothetical protein NDS46_20745 [Paenibacillus thiaminolyticus]|uniref:hypothetical protein n=1 Tax=Paenibacillus thiaminolyticus TaxID=49283 RepID=UPI00232E8A2C|nr:hypothetical protein [Paenibacillus thiaminolyticus]WCF06758.1 hypothetical protein NDS46_20745 [Paenibacillus thiaminolyticus]